MRSYRANYSHSDQMEQGRTEPVASDSERAKPTAKKIKNNQNSSSPEMWVLTAGHANNWPLKQAYKNTINKIF